MNTRTITARFGRVAYCALALLLVIACSDANARLMAQKHVAVEKPWREVVSSEGQFRVLLPDIPNEVFVPVNGQIVHTEFRAFTVKSPVAEYAVLFGDFPESSTDTEAIRAAFDNGRDRALTEGKFILVSEKDISTAVAPAREYVFDDGAFVVRTRVYFVKKRVYQTVFGAPGQRGMSPALVQYYDGLAAKFLNSFKIGA